MEPYQPTGFPWGIHLIFIPLTFAFGFLLGWILRGRAARQERYREKRL